MRNIIDIILGVPDTSDFCKECKRINSKSFNRDATIIEYCNRHSSIDQSLIRIDQKIKDMHITKYGKDYMKG